MRTNRRWLLLLVLCLGGCVQPEPPAASVVPTAVVPATATSTQISPADDNEPAIAFARDAATRAAREQTVRVQAQLRARAKEEQQARAAAQRGNGNERCIAGQKMRRVANGWVQAGDC